MLLGSSSEAISQTIDQQALVGGDGAQAATIPCAAELLTFAEAANRLDDSLPSAREALCAALGTDALIEATNTVAVFRGLNITADSSGIPVDDMFAAAARAGANSLGFGAFTTARNSPGMATTDP